MSRRLKDLTGQRFGSLTVHYRVEGSHPTRWHCVCDCGKEVDVLAYSLTHGRTKSCGASIHRAGIPRPYMSNKLRKDISGQRFGSLVAVEYNSARRRWLCKCDCGGSCYLNITQLKTRHDCGCTLARTLAQRIKEGAAGARQGTNVYRLAHIMEGKIYPGNTTGVTGVSQVKNAVGVSYRAQIMVQGKYISLGRFPTLEEAKQARKAAEQRYFVPLLRKDAGEQENGPPAAPSCPRWHEENLRWVIEDNDKAQRSFAAKIVISGKTYYKGGFTSAAEAHAWAAEQKRIHTKIKADYTRRK